MTNPGSTGMAHLANATKIGSDAISPRCVKIKTLLDGKEMFVPVSGVDGLKQVATPPFPIHLPVSYSEAWIKVGDKMTLVGINKHTDFTIFGTGFTAEVVDHPAWWVKRDTNGI